MAALEQEQLSLDVGRHLERPEGASFKVSGAIGSPSRELYADDGVQVLLMGPDGEVVVSAFGRVSGIAFKKHKPANGRPWVERIHTISFD